jgi:hypothetical protein
MNNKKSLCNPDKYVCLSCGAIVNNTDMITFPINLCMLKDCKGTFLINRPTQCKDCAINTLKTLSHIIDTRKPIDYDKYIDADKDIDFRMFIYNYFNEWNT